MFECISSLVIYTHTHPHPPGLIIKQMMVMAKQDPKLQNVVNNSRGIVMYSVPHRGSPLAGYTHHTKYLLYPSVEVKELTQGEDGGDCSTYNIQFMYFVTASTIWEVMQWPSIHLLLLNHWFTSLNHLGDRRLSHHSFSHSCRKQMVPPDIFGNCKIQPGSCVCSKVERCTL